MLEASSRTVSRTIRLEPSSLPQGSTSTLELVLGEESLNQRVLGGGPAGVQLRNTVLLLLQRARQLGASPRPHEAWSLKIFPRRIPDLNSKSSAQTLRVFSHSATITLLLTAPVIVNFDQPSQASCS